MNGSWEPWAVNTNNDQDFTTAWKRYRNIQKDVFPKAKLVFSVNRNSVGLGMDWRKIFPSKDNVDVMSVDYCNNPVGPVCSQSDWDASMSQTDEYGVPIGLEQHRKFADSVGLPLAISEWSGNAA